MKTEMSPEKLQELRKKGFHSPFDCPVWADSPVRKLWSGRDGRKHCDKCLTYMRPVEDNGGIRDGGE